MAVNTKAIKGRIKSVTNTKKITKAMEMVAAAKMRRAVDAALATREYAIIAKELLDNLAYLDEPTIPILQVRPVKKVLAIMVSSNRGLCGSFNANLFKKAALVLRDTDSLAQHRSLDGVGVMPDGNIELDIL
ncbi:MAG: F0F1 ATP synthase subunit gamma, partial [Candidatus Magasanikbacteria bacterium CG10_big_fil_rev_8_21_14_0_10_43_6]